MRGTARPAGNESHDAAQSTRDLLGGLAQNSYDVRIEAAVAAGLCGSVHGHGCLIEANPGGMGDAFRWQHEPAVQSAWWSIVP